MAAQQEGGLGGRGPAVVDLAEIPLGVGAIEFIADHRVAVVMEMHADLVHPTRVGQGGDEGEAVAGGGGMDEALEDGAALIEWPERLDGHLPVNRLDIVFAAQDATPGRRVRLIAHGNWKGRRLDV